MRIDSHQHFWRYDAEQYAWITDEMPELRADFLPADLHGHLDAAELDGSIAVQARQTLEETDALLELARAKDSRIFGVVGWVDLCSDGVGNELAQLAKEPLLKGVRHVVQDEPDDRFLLREDFGRGIGMLADFGFTYDILVYPKQLPATLRFVERFPEQPFVLDHMAKPLITEGTIARWEAEVRELATFPNVSCKVSGMVTEARWKEWTPEDFRPYLDVVFDAFGEDRLMFGSDWPVCLLAGSYTEVHGLVDEYTHSLTEDARTKLFGGNAARFYGVEERS